MKDKLGKITFYDGRTKDILYYVPLINEDEFMFVTKDGDRYLICCNENEYRKLQSYIIKDNRYYYANIERIEIYAVKNIDNKYSEKFKTSKD